VACELGGRVGDAALLQIIWRGTHDAAVVSEAPRDEARVIGAADAHGTVEARFDQVDHRVRQRELDRHLRMLGREACQHRPDPAASQGHRRRDTQQAARVAPTLRERGLGLFDIRQDRLATLEVQRAFLGQ